MFYGFIAAIKSRQKRLETVLKCGEHEFGDSINWDLTAAGNSDIHFHNGPEAQDYLEPGLYFQV